MLMSIYIRVSLFGHYGVLPKGFCGRAIYINLLLGHNIKGQY